MHLQQISDLSKQNQCLSFNAHYITQLSAWKSKNSLNVICWQKTWTESTCVPFSGNLIGKADWAFTHECFHCFIRVSKSQGYMIVARMTRQLYFWSVENEAVCYSNSTKVYVSCELCIAKICTSGPHATVCILYHLLLLFCQILSSPSFTFPNPSLYLFPLRH